MYVKYFAAQEATTNHLISSLPRRLQLELRLNDLSDYLTRIDVNYRRMLEYAEERDHIEKATLIDFARHVVSHDPSSSINLLERIFTFLSPGRKGITDNGILHSLADSLATFVSIYVVNYKKVLIKFDLIIYIVVIVVFMSFFTRVHLIDW